MAPDEKRETTEEHKETEKDLQKIEQELDEEGDHLHDLKTHGFGVGFSEMADLQARHPLLEPFFECSDDVFNFKKGKKERCELLSLRYLNGTITESERKELKKDFVLPFYEEFFDNAAKVLGLSGTKLNKFRDFKKGYGDNSLREQDVEKLQYMVICFAQTKVRRRFFRRIKEFFMRQIKPLS